MQNGVDPFFPNFFLLGTAKPGNGMRDNARITLIDVKKECPGI